MVGLGQDPPTLFDVVAVESYHQRLGRRVADYLQRVDNAVRDLVARGDATENVDENALDLVVAQNDIKARGHDLGGRAAADVQEVRRLDAPVLLAGVRDDVQ